MRVRGCGLLAGLAVAAAFASPAPAAAQETLFKAQFVCNDRGAIYPLAGARVEFWKRGVDALPKWVTDTRLTVVQADETGRVAIRVNGPEDDFYFRIQLSTPGAQGTPGVRATDWWAPWAWFADTPTNQNDVPVQDYGAQGLGNGTIPPECAAFEAVRQAYDDYATVVGSPPDGGRTVNLNAPSAGVPYSPYTSMFWPPRYPPARQPGMFTTGFHEFAHTVRHGLDGDFLHFGLDLARFNYLTQHSACKKTNRGFAFNEGWAEYWAGDYSPAPNCPGIPATDYAVEGNVAAGLAGLDRFCRGVDRPQMVAVLARNPGRIHSFEEFRNALGCRGLQDAVVTTLRGSGAISLRRRTSFARKQLSSVAGKEARLRRAVRAAVRRARRAPSCPPRPCTDALLRVTLPWLLRAELGQAILLRRTLAFTASAPSLRRLGNPMRARFRRALAARRRAFRVRSARVGARRLRRALVAAATVLRRDRSVGTVTIARRLRAALRSFRAGRLPAGFRIPTPAGSSRLTPIPAPPPTLPPPPAAQPDLVVDSITGFGTSPAPALRVTVRNAGTADAPASTLLLQSRSSASNVTVERGFGVPALAAGASVTIDAPCDNSSAAYAADSATATADSPNAVAEADESNNSRSASGDFCRFN